MMKTQMLGDGMTGEMLRVIQTLNLSSRFRGNHDEPPLLLGPGRMNLRPSIKNLISLPHKQHLKQDDSRFTSLGN
jgi:hypothetical protein